MSDAMVAMSDGMVDGLGTGKCDQGSKNEAPHVDVVGNSVVSGMVNHWGSMVNSMVGNRVVSGMVNHWGSMVNSMVGNRGSMMDSIVGKKGSMNSMASICVVFFEQYFRSSAFFRTQQ